MSKPPPREAHINTRSVIEPAKAICPICHSLGSHREFKQTTHTILLMPNPGNLVHPPSDKKCGNTGRCERSSIDFATDTCQYARRQKRLKRKKKDFLRLGREALA